jgi:hypothetical protein
MVHVGDSVVRGPDPTPPEPDLPTQRLVLRPCKNANPATTAKKRQTTYATKEKRSLHAVVEDVHTSAVMLTPDVVTRCGTMPKCYVDCRHWLRAHGMTPVQLQLQKTTQTIHTTKTHCMPRLKSCIHLR